MNDFIWLIIGLIVLAGCVVGYLRWKTGKIPSQIDRDGDGRLF